MCSKKNMAKMVLVVLNVPIFLLGGLLFVAGLMLRLSSGFLGVEVVTLFNKIEYEDIELGKILLTVAYLLIIFGAFLAVIAILGMCGAWKKIRCCLLSYTVLVVFLIIGQAVLAGLWIHFREQTDQWLKGRMLKVLASYQGPTSTDEISDGWNHLFIKGKCCGVNDQYKNGGTNNDFTEVSSTWAATAGSKKLPGTCCQGVEFSTISTYDASTCPTTPKDFYTEGCYNTIVRYVDTYSLFILIGFGVIVLVQVAAIIAACLIMDRAKNRIRSNHQPAKPPPYVGIDAVLKSKSTRR